MPGTARPYSFITMTVRRTTVPEEKHDLRALRLYREDLLAIVTAVAEAGTLKISGEAMEADSPDDLDQFPPQLTTLTISAVKDDTTSPVIVELTKTAATVKLTDPSTQTRGILMGIRQICEPRRLRLRSRVSRFQSALPLVVLVGAVEIAFVVVTVSVGLGDPKKAAGWIVSPAWLACF